MVALLISLATCLSTYFQARLYLPLYSVFQMGMLLVISLAANALLERVTICKKPRKAEVLNPDQTVTEPRFSTSANVK